MEAWKKLFVGGKPDVVVDFTSPKVIYSNAQTVLAAGIKYGYWHNWLENGRKEKVCTAVCDKIVLIA